MTLYYLLLHFWLKLGDSEFLTRSLSSVFAVATVPVVYVGRPLSDRGPGRLERCFLL